MFKEWAAMLLPPPGQTVYLDYLECFWMGYLSLFPIYLLVQSLIRGSVDSQIFILYFR